ncbi:hypothetical protein [Oharaeibacter diazotrophicus]|uniref:Secreted protein n=1 Tax=Oharaeibacter diazotrophicus TaxID=1920512 RepID=A0A4R6RLM8_9HYPH|nr:hypothetical protein [Oharaeibacter diazotrophicus]TDP87563.1 hypothetical protein EDD54_1462 [Oharaeibacter diazotrophicus]BBE70492.1 hypothetical protein OHA_1_00055 [Pleomorphomonas sp. SM30]GLS77238.1 hypothetical protein GCM10007904_25750 [Oharaeibacter diazotrophicus]
MSARSLATAVALLATLAAGATPATAGVSDPGDALLGAAGVVQKTLTRGCVFSGLGLPAPCPIVLPAPPAGKVLQVLSLACEAVLPTTVKSVDVVLAAPNQPTLFVTVQRIADLGGKARYRTFDTPTLFVAAGNPTVSLAVPVVGAAGSFTCGFVGRTFAP